MLFLRHDKHCLSDEVRIIMAVHLRICSIVDNAVASEAKDRRFESYQMHLYYGILNFPFFLL